MTGGYTELVGVVSDALAGAFLPLSMVLFFFAFLGAFAGVSFASALGILAPRGDA